MSNLIWRGDAKAVAQVVKITPSNPEAGDIFTITINGKDVSYTAAASTVADVVDGLVAAWGAATFPEANDITAAAVDSDGDGASDYLTLTAATAGVPFKVSTSTSDAGGFTVDVDTLTQGDPGQNEKQIVSLPDGTGGGTFTVTFHGQTTGAIAYDASAATLETALEALSNIAAGDVIVTGDAGGPWTVEFSQAYANTDVALLTGDGTNLTGAATLTIDTTTDGAPGTNEIKRANADDLGILNVWQWKEGGNTYETGSWGKDASEAEIQSKLEALGQIGSGNTIVTKTSAGILVEFIGDLAGTDIGDFLFLGVTSTSTLLDTVQEGDPTDIDEVQTVRINGSPTGGTFTLTFQGQTTGTIAFDADAATVETALEALSNVDAVTVTKSGNTYTVTFEGTNAGTDLAEMTGDASSLTGGGVTVFTSQEATQTTNELQQVNFSQPPSGGTFTLSWDPGGGDETTAAIDHDATASEVQTALENLTTPGAGDFSVTGDAGGPWVIEFQGSYAGTDVNEITGNGANLTGGGAQGLSVETTTRSAGPNHFDDPDNWTGESVPNATDSLFFNGGAINCLWGLKQRAEFTADAGTDTITMDGGDAAEFREDQGVRLYTTDTLPAGLSTGTTVYIKDLDIDAGTCKLSATPGGAAIDITDTGTGTHTIALRITLLTLHTRWSGALGLTERHDAGFYEYRPRSLAAVIDDIVVGEGDGDGQPRIDLDTGNEETAITVYQTGGGQEAGLPAMRWRGTHASNTVAVHDGEFGAAVYATETATIDALTQRGGLIQMGTVTLGDIDKTAGELIADDVTMNGSLALRG